MSAAQDNYVSKPFQEDLLSSRIQTILANSSDRAEANRGDSDDVYFMGNQLRITSTKEQILDFLGSTFEDYIHARQREFESALVQEKQNARTEAYRIREELVRKEKETLRRSHQFLQSTLNALTTRIAILDASGTILAANTASAPAVGGGPDRGQGLR